MKRQFLTILFLFGSVAAFSQAAYRSQPSREAELNKKYTSGLFSYPDADYFDLENDANATGAISYLNVLDWLQGRVAGLQVYNIRMVKVPFIRNSPAAVYVDEMRVDPGYLNLLPVTDIAMIKVMKTPTALFWGAPGGAIAIYTKHGDEGEEADETAMP